MYYLFNYISTVSNGASFHLVILFNVFSNFRLLKGIASAYDHRRCVITNLIIMIFITSKNNLQWLFKQFYSVFPSITNTVFFIAFLLLYTFNLFWRSIWSLISLIMNMSSFFDLRPVLILTLIAVSYLSPVNIHIFIPANFKDSIVSYTLSCSLSSTPVTPLLL
jgi:hypothetical protein